MEEEEVVGKERGGGGNCVKPWTIQDLSLPNMPSVLSQSISIQVMWICWLFTGREGAGGLSHQQSSFSQDRGHFITPIICWFVSDTVDYFTFGFCWHMVGCSMC